MSSTTLLGTTTHKVPLVADVDGRPRIGTLTIPLDLVSDGTGVGYLRVRVEPLNPETVLHAHGHDGCPEDQSVDVLADLGGKTVLIGTLDCCPTCRPR